MHRAVIGLGFGDETKGSFVDYLCSVDEPLAVVRFNGGAQAAHNVITNDGMHHTFSQFGSGTLRGIPTVLSRFMMLNPLSLAMEAHALLNKTGADPYMRLYVSENALVTTPLHILLNQAREDARGANRHGSVGMGVGETMNFALKFPELAIYVRDLRDYSTLWRKLEIMRRWAAADEGFPLIEAEPSQAAARALMNAAEPVNIVTDEFISQVLRSGNVVFEGAQGILLDQDYGFHPHTTWSKTTANNLLELLRDAGQSEDQVRITGVLRTYHTRHGAGPMPSEFADPEAQRERFPEPHNAAGKYQGGWRLGRLDLPLLKYALGTTRVDELGISHLDVDVKEYVKSYGVPIPVAQSRDDQIRLTKQLFELAGKGIVGQVKSSEELVDIISAETGKPVSYLSYGPTASDKKLL